MVNMVWICFVIIFSTMLSICCCIFLKKSILVLSLLFGGTIGIIIALPFTIILFIILKVVKKYRTLVILILFISLTVCILLVFKNPSNSRSFKRFVIEPIPASVKDMKKDLMFNFGGHIYVLNFKISNKDLNLILTSKPFEKVNFIGYEDDTLEWRKSGYGKHTFPIYPNYNERKPPPWFNLHLWKSPAMYEANISSGHEQYLIYESQIEEVYFIDYSTK